MCVCVCVCVCVWDEFRLIFILFVIKSTFCICVVSQLSWLGLYRKKVLNHATLILISVKKKSWLQVEIKENKKKTTNA